MPGTLYAVLCRIDRRLKDLIANRYTIRLAGVDPTGLVDALLYSWRLDLWHRYRAIRQAALLGRAGRPLRLLDVGGGSGKIAEFIDPRAHPICVLDRRRGAIHGLPGGVRGVVGDMARLPFKDASVEVVVSADAVEHIPPGARTACLREMRRVASETVIVHCPIQQEDAGFAGARYDLKFNTAHRRLFGAEEPNVREHIDSGAPTLEQMRQALPGAAVKGTQNASIWYFCMLAGRIPFIGLLVGPLYRLCLSRRSRKPPYYTGLFVDSRPGGGR